MSVMLSSDKAVLARYTDMDKLSENATRRTLCNIEISENCDFVPCIVMVVYGRRNGIREVPIVGRPDKIIIQKGGRKRKS